MLVGFVPHPERDERGCVLEVVNALGEAIKVIVVPECSVKPLRANEVPSARSLTEAVS